MNPTGLHKELIPVYYFLGLVGKEPILVFLLLGGGFGISRSGSGSYPSNIHFRDFGSKIAFFSSLGKIICLALSLDDELNLSMIPFNRLLLLLLVLFFSYFSFGCGDFLF